MYTTEKHQHPPAYSPPAYNPYPSTIPRQPPAYETVVSGHPTYQYPQNNAVLIHGAVPVVTTHTTVIPMPQQLYEPEHIGYSIFTMIWCFLPLGLAALIFSFKTRSCNRRGDAAGARKNSRTSLTLNHISIGIGILVTIAYVSFLISYWATWNTHSSGCYGTGCYG
ncbi:hypothetical protein NDU88_010757 [Pleurodeles waltl]|uniref:Uncharacterized protein n=1 Tax=Pleurodeles waltl TaxID=8319 RepID=A0AAV7PYV0_PLEWA|nr:hypothetical protein NDU88_010757 [Pleurodeles waltl]